MSDYVVRKKKFGYTIYRGLWYLGFSFSLDGAKSLIAKDKAKTIKARSVVYREQA